MLYHSRCAVKLARRRLRRPLKRAVSLPMNPTEASNHRIWVEVLGGRGVLLVAVVVEAVHVGVPGGAFLLAEGDELAGFPFGGALPFADRPVEGGGFVVELRFPCLDARAHHDAFFQRAHGGLALENVGLLGHAGHAGDRVLEFGHALGPVFVAVEHVLPLGARHRVDLQVRVVEHYQLSHGSRRLVQLCQHERDHAAVGACGVEQDSDAAFSDAGNDLPRGIFGDVFFEEVGDGAAVSLSEVWSWLWWCRWLALEYAIFAAVVVSMEWEREGRNLESMAEHRVWGRSGISRRIGSEDSGGEDGSGAGKGEADGKEQRHECAFEASHPGLGCDVDVGR